MYKVPTQIISWYDDFSHLQIKNQHLRQEKMQRKFELAKENLVTLVVTGFF